MISLTKQQWFDAAWRRAKNSVRSKKMNSHNVVICTYDRTVNGGCFIGCVDTNDVLKDNEDCAEALYQKGLINIIDLNSENGFLERVFLGKLQYIHDNCEPIQWKNRLLDFANFYNLQVPE